MQWGWEIFYGLATATAFGLSWKRGGPIAIAGTLVAAMWLFQGLIYLSGLTFVGNLMGSMISATLLVMIARLKLEAALYVVMTSLVCQLYMHATFRLHGPYVTEFYIALNVLYLIQLIALGWSGGKIVLDSLGDWLARVWRYRAGVHSWASCVVVGLWEIGLAYTSWFGRSRAGLSDDRHRLDRRADVGQNCGLCVPAEKG